MRGSFVRNVAVVAAMLIATDAMAQTASVPAVRSPQVPPGAVSVPMTPLVPPRTADAAPTADPKFDARIDAFVDDVFPKMDRDHSGKLSRNEFLSYGVANQLGNALKFNRFKQMDTDHDGSVSKAEFRADIVAYDEKRRSGGDAGHEGVAPR